MLGSILKCQVASFTVDEGLGLLDFSDCKWEQRAVGGRAKRYFTDISQIFPILEFMSKSLSTNACCELQYPQLRQSAKQRRYRAGDVEVVTYLGRTCLSHVFPGSSKQWQSPEPR